MDALAWTGEVVGLEPGGRIGHRQIRIDSIPVTRARTALGERFEPAVAGGCHVEERGRLVVAIKLQLHRLKRWRREAIPRVTRIGEMGTEGQAIGVVMLVRIDRGFGHDVCAFSALSNTWLGSYPVSLHDVLEPFNFPPLRAVQVRALSRVPPSVSVRSCPGPAATPSAAAALRGRLPSIRPASQRPRSAAPAAQPRCAPESPVPRRSVGTASPHAHRYP